MITPSRKVSFIIILNKNDYNEECLKILCNRHFCELKKDPSASYKDRFTNFCHILLHDSLITKNKLKCNVMSFNGWFFHQIKGMAMGTPMAVSFANIFMSGFEQCLLHEHEQRYKRKPAIWLRFIYDRWWILTSIFP